jgi:bacterioferritin-associated ferredoxin
MDPDQPVCLCFKVSQRKLVNFLNREKPNVPSQLSDCLGAGTGCQWCVPSLCALHAEWKAGKEPDLAVDATEYAEQRKEFRATGKRPD